MFLRKRKGQSILEYAILIAIIVAAILIMQTFMKRGVQGRLKDSSDRISGGDSFSASNSTILENRQMSTNREIHDETTTGNASGDSVISDVVTNDFAGITANAPGFAVSTTGTGAASASAVTGGTTTSVTQAKMGTAKGEAFRSSEYTDTDAGNFATATSTTSSVGNATDVFQ